MQMETNRMIRCAVTNTSPPRPDSPPVTVTWNMVCKTRGSSLQASALIKRNLSVSNVCLLLLDDLPDLQEVREETESTSPPVYQVELGVSHQERNTQTHRPEPPDTRWLTQLAHIATGPQSPLLQEPPDSR